MSEPKGIRIEVIDDAVSLALQRLAEADRTEANDAVGAAILDGSAE